MGYKVFKPVEKIRILRGRDGARKGLVKMMMGIDQSRQNNVTFEIKHFISCGRKSFH